MILAGFLVAFPFLSAAILAGLSSWRLGMRVNAAAATITFVLACGLPMQAGQANAILLADPLAVHIALLTTFVAMTTSWYSVAYVPGDVARRRLDRRRVRIYHVGYQCFLGGLLLGLLSNNLGVTWVGLETATIAAVIVVSLPRTEEAVEASWKMFIICGVGIALALFGTVLLYLAALPVLGPGLAAMSWTALASAAPECDAAILDLAFVFMLIGYGTKAALAPLHTWMPNAHAEGPTPVSAVLAGSVLNVALIVILRLRTVMAANAGAFAPGPPIMGLGLLSLLIAAFSLWRRQDVKSFFAFSSIEQTGIAAFAFGLGGQAAIFAGLLHMTLHTLTKAAIFQSVGRAAQFKRSQRFADISGLLITHKLLGLTLAAGIVAIAAVPPFGLFTSEFLIATETVRHAPWLSLPLGVGIVTGGCALVARLQTLCLGAPSPDVAAGPKPLDLAPAWVHLALVLMLGLFMPAAVFEWMRAIAAAAAS